ncbi:MAG: AAA family ATPase, partial [Actinomycetota bacterium]|nr:AAA family ATPase [Actinomycetota bacterium]
MLAGGLFEREGVLNAVRELVHRAGSYAGGAIRLEAAAGMGKTAVLQEVRSRAGAARVLAARGADLEQDYPLGVVRQLLEPALRRASRDESDRWLTGAAIAPVLLRGETAVAVEEGAAFNALYWVLAAMSADGPVLLTVDDVHWCDRESLRWIGYVLRRLDGLRLVMVLASRPPGAVPLDRAFAALTDDPDVQTLRLEPLSERAVRAIVRAEWSAADDAFVAACHEACGGNPFVLGELLSAARERRLAPTVANAARVASLASAGLQRAVLGRLAALGDDAVAVARATALLGTEVALSRVAALAGLPLRRASDAAETLQRVELLAPGTRLSFRHPLLRAAVMADLGEVAIVAGHRRAARVLIEHDAPAEEVAAHLLGCDPLGEPWAADILRQAARDALARASPRLAGRLFERALKEPMGTDRRLLEAEMGGALATAGDPRGIDALLSAARDVADPVERAGVVVRLGIPM